MCMCQYCEHVFLVESFLICYNWSRQASGWEAAVVSIRKPTMEVLSGIPQSKVSNATGSKVNSCTKTL